MRGAGDKPPRKRGSLRSVEPSGSAGKLEGKVPFLQSIRFWKIDNMYGCSAVSSCSVDVSAAGQRGERGVGAGQGGRALRIADTVGAVRERGIHHAFMNKNSERQCLYKGFLCSIGGARGGLQGQERARGGVGGSQRIHWLTPPVFLSRIVPYFPILLVVVGPVVRSQYKLPRRTKPDSGGGGARNNRTQ